MRASDFLPSHVIPTATLANGSSLGRFVVLGLVGRGAMGEVYARLRPELDRKVAIKLVRARDGARRRGRRQPRAPHARGAGDGEDLAPQRRRRATTPARSRTACSSPWSSSRATRCATGCRRGPRTWREILEVFLAAGRGLAAAHDEGARAPRLQARQRHGGGDGQVRVMDFGLARMVATRDALEGRRRPHRRAARRRRNERRRSSSTATSAHEARATSAGRRIPGVAGRAATRSSRRRARCWERRRTCRPSSFAAGSPTRAPISSASASRCTRRCTASGRSRGARSMELDENRRRGAPGRAARADARARRGCAACSSAACASTPASASRRWTTLVAELSEQPGRRGRRGFATGAAAKLAGDLGGARRPVTPSSTPEKDGDPPGLPGDGQGLRGGDLRRTRAPCSIASRTLVGPLRRRLRGDARARRAVDGGPGPAHGCLMEGLRDLTALCRLFRTATREVVENAVSAAMALPRRNAAGTSSSCARSSGPRRTRPRRRL